MITVGIDPGLTGAVGILEDGAFVSVHDIPTVAKGAGSVKTEVDPAALKRLLREAVRPHEAVVVALERVNAMPGQGASSVFSLGDSFGSIRAVAACCGFELRYVAPAKWKRAFHIGRDKEVARALAVRMFPEAPLGLKKHADRAEALLIARWLFEEER